MKIEYALHDIESNDKAIKAEIENIAEYPVCQISVLPQHLKIIQKIIPKHITLSSIIDYPFGISNTKIRKDMISFCADNGAENIEIIAPNKLLCNRQYAAIQHQLSDEFNYCVEKMLDIAYVLEYRRFTFSAISRIVKGLQGQSIHKCYVSTGNKLDNIHDHLIAIAMLKKDCSEMTIPYNGNLWLKEHVDLLHESEIKISRVRSMNALNLLFNKIA